MDLLTSHSHKHPLAPQDSEETTRCTAACHHHGAARAMHRHDTGDGVCHRGYSDAHPLKSHMANVEQHEHDDSDMARIAIVTVTHILYFSRRV